VGEILRIRWFGKWVTARNPLLTPTNYPRYDPSEIVASGAFRCFSPEQMNAET